jgi:CheY-like chemotaxis protein
MTQDGQEKSYRILVVDDVLQNIQIIENMLQKGGTRDSMDFSVPISRRSDLFPHINSQRMLIIQNEHGLAFTSPRIY